MKNCARGGETWSGPENIRMIEKLCEFEDIWLNGNYISGKGHNICFSHFPYLGRGPKIILIYGVGHLLYRADSIAN